MIDEDEGNEDLFWWRSMSEGRCFLLIEWSHSRRGVVDESRTDSLGLERRLNELVDGETDATSAYACPEEEGRSVDGRFAFGTG